MTARLLVSSVIGCFAGCAYIGALQTWNPARAADDAERDIAAHKIRFAYIGGRASYPPGLPEEASSEIIRQYPILPVGEQGCEQDEGYDTRKEYATRYNIRTWQYVSKLARPSSNKALQTCG